DFNRSFGEACRRPGKSCQLNDFRNSVLRGAYDTLMQMDAFAFNLPTQIIFGAGSIDTLAQHVPAFGERPVFVAGNRAVHASGLRSRLEAMLPGAGWIDGVPENPTTTVCGEAARHAVALGADQLIAVGGGSVMDAAKAIAILARNPPPC